VGDSVIHYDHRETVGPVGHVLEGRLSALYTRRNDKQNVVVIAIRTGAKLTTIVSVIK